MRGFFAALGLLFASAVLVFAAEGSNKIWDPPSPITPKTAFFNETPRETANEAARPKREDKGYPWYYLEKGNKHFSDGEYLKAVEAFREAYSVPGPTRLLSALRLIESLERSDRVDDAMDVMEELERHHLVGPREREEAKRVKMRLLDRQRADRSAPPPPAKFTGREWVLELQTWRLQYVLGAMDELRRHGVPIQEPVHKYVFLLDEYFLANPGAPAGNANETLASLIYRTDPKARLYIDRWRMNPEGTLTEEAKIFDQKPNRMTGADWLVMVHDAKLAYTAEAMQVLQEQHVPMKKSLYGYTDAIDKLFTKQPELQASDGAVTLASYLYENEPEAREVLEALRLE